MAALCRLSASIWWADTKSVIVFSSDQSMDDITEVVKAYIDTTKDVAVVANTENNQMRVFGTLAEQDICRLLPPATRLCRAIA